MTTQHTTVPLQSLGCASGGRAAIERALLDIPGVLRAYVNPVTEMAYVEFDPALSDAQVIGAVIRQTGYAEMRPVPPPTVHPSGERSDVDTARVALATGVWLAAAFAACAIVRAVLPAADGAFRLWTLVLPGVQTLRWWELVLGLAESFASGLIGGWVFALIYNRLGPRPPRSGTAGNQWGIVPRSREVV